MDQEKKKSIRTDFCVIGAGSGGLSFAAGAAQMGASVVLLEAHRMGGDCLNAGCVPSKALIAASRVGHDIARGTSFGWTVGKSSVDFKGVYDHVRGVIDAIAPHDSVERFEGLGVKVIQEAGKFVDPTTVETATYRIKAKRFIIATGSVPFIPPIKGLSSIPFFTNETIFDLKTLPSHLAIIGGGPIGLEMAQAFRRLGSQVTVLDAASILPKDDPDVVEKLKEILVSEGVVLIENATIVAVQQCEGESRITYQRATSDKEEDVRVSHVLVATGRKPNVENLNLEAADIKSSARGIEVDRRLRTSNKKVYAIGDCIGGYQFTHVAGYHAGVAIRNALFGLRTGVETRAIPWVTYTDPELAHVGFLASELEAKAIPYRVLRMDFQENDRAQAERRTEGRAKVLVSPRGQVLGVTILGLHAGELIYPWVIAIQNRLKLTAITGSIAPYPTLSDLSKRLAGSFYTDKIFSPRMGKIVRFIMKWFR